MTQTTLNITTLRQAIEQENVDVLATLYADDACLTIVDTLHPPSAPLELKGKEAICDFYTDNTTRHLACTIVDEVISKEKLAFTELCQYPGGQPMLAATFLDLRDGLITRQFTIQVWDE
ncbi:SnoaL-like protein [Thermosporothrix hazakensis]|jgi:hypothetical protein|uniref:SnoaL-like protein n=2 Tax=Thermosporothrix TaxID=768650 RepID=A0A326UFM1_THEHA|nr:nuclear transport factor 2 family protein [Thermosporothrix hazakensis]PZW34494.1 SnoaL-like protein [Thermosporothrix hazakensis]BBH85615.1 hypothetical protein KTC_03660 [Thermosporothrix sp. COM3]GCE45956.1 hypothetical protein KTH_08250 [Thermosporothrix hazakensis]